MENKEGRILSFEEICAADDLTTKDVYVDEWRGAVRLKTLSGELRDKYVAQVQSRMVGIGKARRLGNPKGLTVALLQSVLIKDDGCQLFSSTQQLEKMQQKNGEVIGRLFDIAQEMNGLNDTEVVKHAGNSESDQNKDTGDELQTPLDAPLQKPSDG